jgi:hypothetical protein
MHPSSAFLKQGARIVTKRTSYYLRSSKRKEIGKIEHGKGKRLTPLEVIIHNDVMSLLKQCLMYLQGSGRDVMRECNDG